MYQLFGGLQAPSLHMASEALAAAEGPRGIIALLAGMKRPRHCRDWEEATHQQAGLELVVH